MKAELFILFIFVTVIYSAEVIEANPFDASSVPPLDQDKLLACAEMITSKAQNDQVFLYNLENT